MTKFYDQQRTWDTVPTDGKAQVSDVESREMFAELRRRCLPHLTPDTTVSPSIIGRWLHIPSGRAHTIFNWFHRRGVLKRLPAGMSVVIRMPTEDDIEGALK